MRQVLSFFCCTLLVIAQESTSHLKLEQVNKIVDSTFSEEGIKSQGTTLIEDDAFVDNVHILQKPGVDEVLPGNLIEDSVVTSDGSHIHQGLTQIKSGAKLQDSKLESENTIKNLQAISGESFVSQANVVIGEDSNVTNLINGGDGNDIGDGTADQFVIKETNLIQDINVKNTTIQQGLISIEEGSSASDLEIVQVNSMRRGMAQGKNEMNASSIFQGHLQIKNSRVDNITQNIENDIDNTEIDNGVVQQSTIGIENSEVSDINNHLSYANLEHIEKNEIQNTTITNAKVNQSTLNINNSRVEILQKFHKKGLAKNNLIDTVTAENNATLDQSVIVIGNESKANNIELKTAQNIDKAQEAINEIKVVTLGNDSAIYQDKIELDNAVLNNVIFTRVNSIKDVNVDDEATLRQFHTYINGSKVEESKFSDKSYLKNTQMSNSQVTQGLTKVQ